MRVHIIFYSLSGNIDILPVNLHRQNHFSEDIHKELSLNNSLFGCLIYVTIMLEQSVEDLLLYFGKLDVIRVCLFLRVGRHNNTTCWLKHADCSKRSDCRHRLETREFLAFVCCKSAVCKSWRTKVICNHRACKISRHLSCICFWNNNRRFWYAKHLSILPVVVISLWKLNLFQESNCSDILEWNFGSLSFYFGLTDKFFSNSSAGKIDVSNNLKHLCKVVCWKRLKRILIRTKVICT